MTRDFGLLMAVLLTECVRLNGGPITVSREVVEAFDPFKNRVHISPTSDGTHLVISVSSAEIIEGEVVDTD